MRLRRAAFTCFNLAMSRLRMVLRITMNLPFFQVFPQMCVSPKKWNVSGLPSPRRFRFSAANRPNSIRRVLSGCNSQLELPQPLSPILEKSFCLRSVLKPQYHVVRIANHDDLARSSMRPPVLYPKVEDVM